MVVYGCIRWLYMDLLDGCIWMYKMVVYGCINSCICMYKMVVYGCMFNDCKWISNGCMVVWIYKKVVYDV